MAGSLSQYFNTITDVLAARAVVAGDSAENADIGVNRELICREFLEKHVPKRFSINIGGDIFGIGPVRSGQIDVIVNHDMSMNFKENHRIRCPVESVTAAIAVKSTLTKSELHGALENLASIPQCTESVVNFSPLSSPVSKHILSWPSLFVFAYDGVSYDKYVEHVVDFYSHNHVPFNRIPRSIIVNGKYQLAFEQHTIPNATIHSTFDRQFLRGYEAQQPNRGAPLFWMLQEMAKGLSMAAYHVFGLP